MPARCALNLRMLARGSPVKERSRVLCSSMLRKPYRYTELAFVIQAGKTLWEAMASAKQDAELRMQYWPLLPSEGKAVVISPTPSAIQGTPKKSRIFARLGSSGEDFFPQSNKAFGSCDA